MTPDTPADTPATPEPELVTMQARTTAVVRGSVPMAELRDFFDRAFGLLAEALASQGIAPQSAAFGLYHGPPGESVDLEVGFVTDRAIDPAGDVVPSELPGGRVARLIHHGSFDRLGESWGRLGSWIGGQGMAPGPSMWEVYLTEPSPDMDPDELRTELNWLVID